ncbi:MAG TPA: acyl-CoA dehydrogenase family protein [Acidimicrobiales bacterium]|nr:acyl-CoA dehydrogenase family protein [Acidimicrobiales bacterium]
MTLTLTDELEAYRRAVRAQAESTIGPFVKALDCEQRFSREVWDALRATDIFALPFPETAGGLGGSFLAFVVATEQIAAVGATAALYPGTTVQVASTLLHYGTPSQIECWVPLLLRGDAPAAWAFTEPQTGSDPKQLLTTAVRDGDGWVLTGQKLFISLARQAAIALVFARTSDDRVGAFLVDPSSPGWSTGQPFELMAFGGVEAAPVYLDDVRVPSDAVVGDSAHGFEVLLAGEGQGKIRVAAICVGIAQRALEEARRYALERKHRGEPIGRKFATIQGLLGDMQASTLSARALVRSAAVMFDEGADVHEVAAAARLVAGRTAREVTSAALQVCGAYGLTRELPLERLYREGKFYEVAQGVAEIQRAVVARRVMDATR